MTSTLNKILKNACEKTVLNKFQVYNLQMQLSISQVLFKDFVCLLGAAILRNNSFVLRGQNHIHSIRDFQSKPICSQSNYIFVVLERDLWESSCSEAFDKTGEVVNNVLI